MAGCCEDKTCALESLKQKQRRILIIVLIINALMFCVEYAAGWLAGSAALLADSLDMLGDALIYGFSLFVLFRSSAWRASAALFKGGLMWAFGLSAFAGAIYKVINGVPPSAHIMSGVGFLALAANLYCYHLLTAHRRDDVNMRSVWLCSRNDIIANIGVLGAAGAVAVTASHWPDIVVGLLVAAIFLKSAWTVTREALGELRSAQRETPA